MTLVQAAGHVGFNDAPSIQPIPAQGHTAIVLQAQTQGKWEKIPSRRLG